MAIPHGNARLIAAALGFAAALLGSPAAPQAQASEDGAANAEVVLNALGLVGVPYRYGGTDPATGLDCSGLVRYVVAGSLGLQLPRQADAMSLVGSAVDRGELQPGDLVFFNTLGRPFSHVGVYVHDGRFVHAPARRGHVRIESMTQPYWVKRYNGARRLAPLPASMRAEAMPPVAEEESGRRTAEDGLTQDKP